MRSPLYTLRLFAGLLLLGAPSLISAPEATNQPFSSPARPSIDSPWWPIAGNPDLGELTSDRQQPVDFGVWQAVDGTWQLWSCIRKTHEPGHTRLFHAWEGAALSKRNWTPMGIVMQAEPTLGEPAGGLQAPYVLLNGARYLMFYGNWEQICMSASSDGKKFERLGDAKRARILFGEAPEAQARDPHVIRVEGLWHCYYAAGPNRRGAVYARTSPDLRNWSEHRIVHVGGRGGEGPWNAECPHVIQRDGWFYLFRTQRYGEKNLTHVYASQDPLDFGPDDDCYVASLPIAAPEIVRQEGQDFIVALNLGLDGIRMARLGWDRSPR